ncbi:MAG: hypothetical protein U9R01_07830, partial [candidate division WOR-3 bacterium]|nr:hypothetical protein [candidate division WOR-3 bacterium]
VSFSVTIDSTSWTQIIPEDSKRRYAVIEATSTSNEGFICVSTFTTTSIECTNSVIGQKIGLTRHYIEDYSEAILYGRNSSASSLYLIGEYQYDSAD